MRHLVIFIPEYSIIWEGGGRGCRLSTGVRLRFVLLGVYRMACRDWNRHCTCTYIAQYAGLRADAFLAMRWGEMQSNMNVSGAFLHLEKGEIWYV